MVTYDLGKVVGDKGAKGAKGDTGATGNGISGIELISTSGKTKTYRISYTNGSHFDFNVVDGADGGLEVVTSWGSSLSDTKVASEKLTKNSLDGKSDANHTHSGYASSSHTHGNLKNDGSVGSSNNALKNVVTDSNGKITTEAKPIIPKVFYGTCSTAASEQVKIINTASDFVLETGIILMVKFTYTQTYVATTSAPLQLKINNNSNVNVALYGSNYNLERQWVNGEIVSFIFDGTDFRIGNRSVASTTYFGVTRLTSDLSSTSEGLAATALAVKTLNDNKVDKTQTNGLLKNDGSVMSSGTGASNWAVGNHTHSGYVSATKVNSWSGTPSNSNVPSEKLVKDTFDELEALIGDAIAYINQ